MSYLEYLDFVADPKIYGTEFDIVMLYRFLEISIYMYTAALLVSENGKLRCEPPMHLREKDIALASQRAL
jgi:hypothetical protein